MTRNPAHLARLQLNAAIFCLLAVGISNLFVAGAAASSLGLTVGRDGVLLRHGTPYRGIGVNYYDAFVRKLRNPADDTYEAGFAQLGAHGIPFARLSIGGFRGSDFQLYVSDKSEYFRRLDRLVQTAEKSHVGLIPSLFWNISAVSEIVHESPERWADKSSETRQFMRKFTRDVVSHYSDSPTIWGWEFSCELSLPVDMKPGTAKYPLSYDTFRSAALDFAQVVRAIDSERMVLTGNSLPRPAAYHNASGGGRGPDTENQFGQILLRDNPGPYNPICIHASPANVGPYFADRHVSYQELLAACVRFGATAGKAVYLEEFIPRPKNPGSSPLPGEREYFLNELAAIERSNISLASVWVYDRKLANDEAFNLTFDNERSYMLQEIAKFDGSVRAQR